MSRPMTLEAAADRIGKSERTLWRWQKAGVLRILSGGFVIEDELVVAEAKMRQRRLLARHRRETPK